MDRKKHFVAVSSASAVAATGMALAPGGLILTAMVLPVLLWLAFIKVN